MRCAQVSRTTRETSVSVSLRLDGSGKSDIETPVGMLTHMLEAFASHGAFDLELRATGDIDVDQHHTVEDIGLVLGQAFDKALGTREGIYRAGYFVMPMDEALALVAVDIGGRSYLRFDCTYSRRWCGGLDTDLVEDMLQAFSSASGANISVSVPAGRSDHHRLEATFKALARAMRMACSLDPAMSGLIPSGKGVID